MPSSEIPRGAADNTFDVMLGLTLRYQFFCGWSIRPTAQPGIHPRRYREAARRCRNLFKACCAVAATLQVCAGYSLYRRRWPPVIVYQILAAGMSEIAYMNRERSAGYWLYWQSYGAQQQQPLSFKNLAKTTLQQGLLREVSQLPPEQCEAIITEPHRMVRLFQHVAATGAARFTEYCVAFGTRLRELDLRHPVLARELTDEQLEEILANCPSVERIHLPYRWSVVRFQRIYEKLPRLIDLDFRPVAHLITDEEVATMIRSRSPVRSVNLAHCFLARELTLAALQDCATLESLDLTDWRGPLPAEGWLEGRELQSLTLRQWYGPDASKFLTDLGAQVRCLRLSWGFREALPDYLARRGSKTEKVQWLGAPPSGENWYGCSFPTGCDKLTYWHLPLERVDNAGPFLDGAKAAGETAGVGGVALPKRGLPEVPEWAKKSIEELDLSGGCSEKPEIVFRALCRPLIYLRKLSYDCSGHTGAAVWEAVTTEVKNLTALHLEGSGDPFQLRQDHIDQLIRAHPDLKTLSLSVRFTLSHDTCNYLVKYLPKLKRLRAKVEGDEKDFKPKRFRRLERLEIAVPAKRLAELDNTCPQLCYHPWDQSAEGGHVTWDKLFAMEEILGRRLEPSPLNCMVLELRSQEDIERAVKVLLQTPQLEELYLENRWEGTSYRDYTPLLEAIPTSVRYVYVKLVVLEADDLIARIHHECPQVTSFSFPSGHLAEEQMGALFDKPSPVVMLQPLGNSAPRFNVPPSIPVQCLGRAACAEQNPLWKRDRQPHNFS
jgi:hypothetical protein